jgi:putative MATE family efflux protein
MFSSSKDNALLAMIRSGQEMSGSQKLNLIVQLSVPSILAQLTTIMMFYIDASMVGSLGAKASASIGIVESTTWLFGGLTSAAALGFSVQVAHFIGANDFAKARQVFRQGLMATVLFTLILTSICVAIAGPLPRWLGGGEDICGDATAYFTIYCLALPVYQLGILSSSMLKCSGNMRIPSFMSILMCLLDVVFNFFLIYETRPATVLGVDVTIPGAGMGVPGAALGTALAYAVTGVMLIWFATVRSPELSLKNEKWSFAPMWNYLRNAAKVSLPMGAQYMMMSGAQIVSTMIVAPLGNIAIAANTLAITAESLCYMPGYGIGDAATTLVGQSIGAGRSRLARSFAYRTVFLGMGVMAFMGMVMYIFAPEMIGVMTPDADVRLLGSQSLRIEAFAEPMFAAAIVTYSVCLGAGDTLIPATMNLATMWLVRLTLAAHLAPTYGLRGVWMAMAIELTLRGTVFLIRLFSGKWLKKGFK